MRQPRFESSTPSLNRPAVYRLPGGLISGALQHPDHLSIHAPAALATRRFVKPISGRTTPRWYNPGVPEESLQRALDQTRRAAFGRIATLLGASELSQEFWEELEASLVQADLGMPLISPLLEQLKGEARSQGYTNGRQVRSALREALLGQLSGAEEPLPTADQQPFVTLVVGVNGSGKTTTAAKLAWRWKERGKQVILAAADTYRAAAREQLDEWARQMQIPMISAEHGSDPGAVVYNACQAAAARGADALLIDTSGRMHTEHNLMAELEKIHRVAGKVIPAAPHCSLLVLDATTGQNGIAQARAFSQTIALDGVVLAKLDGSARGGVGLAIQQQLNLPIAFVGLGEKLQDLEVFDPTAYVNGLMPPE
jgi:fused signal recognition particle receptor